MKKTAIAIIVSLVTLVAGGLYWNTAAAATQSVTIQNFAFSPSSITVAPGTTVTWTNKDNTAHTVTADSGTGPNSGQLMQNQTYSFTYQQPGTYPYHCSIHPQMKATVIVSSSSSSGGSGGGTSSNQSSNSPSQTQNQSQSQSQSMQSMGGMGAGGTSSSTSTQQSSGGAVATGPVAAGAGTAATKLSDAAPLIAGSALLATTALLYILRRVFAG